MKKLLTLIAIIIVLTSALVSCDFLTPAPDGDGGENIENGNDTDDGGNTEESESTEHTHEFGEWITTVEPTCAEQGVSERSCTCGEKETKIIDRTSHNIDSGVCTICGMKFSEGLEFVSNGDGTCYVKGIGSCQDVELVIPHVSPSGDTVTSVADEAFRRNMTLTKLILPATLISIGNLAFQYCYNVESIIFEAESQLATIGRMSFYYCESITSIVIPKNVTSMGEGAFGSCLSLLEFKVEEGNTSYKAIDGNLYNFDETEFIQYALGKTEESFTIPESVVTIGLESFRYCDTLKAIFFAENCKVTTIEASAFSYCTALVDIIIPESVTVIKESAFSNCEALSSITIPESVTEIASWLFGYCKSLTAITLHAGITSIGNSAFYRCEFLENVICAESSRLTTIAERAFYECYRLKSITIPASVTIVGKDAFAYCYALSDVHYGGTPDQWSAISIGKSNDSLKNATIHYS